ncbi:MAG: aldo/keto reductase [bacterium]
MKYRRFGRTGWQVSEIGYGMWGMAGWTGSDDEESMQSLQRAVDLGCTFFDTAWAYGEGKSESFLGNLVRANSQKKLYTATKIPPKNFKWPSKREYSLEDCFPPDHIEKYVESSLQNSGLESFDLIQFHTWEDLWLEYDRWYTKLMDLKSQGHFHAIMRRNCYERKK